MGEVLQAIENAPHLVAYSEQGLNNSEKEMITEKHLDNIIQNYSFMSKKQIVNEIINLKDLRSRY